MNRRRMPLRALAAAILIGVCLGLMPQLALALDLSCVVASGATENAVLHAQDESDGTYLFLPSQADVENLGLSSSQGVVEVWSYAARAYVDASEGANLVDLGVANLDGTVPQSGATLWVRLGGTTEARLTVMKSSGIRSVFVSADHDISYVNSSASHSVSDSGTVTVLSPDTGDVIYDGALDAIRGRGNTTWTNSEKKPYQMKLSKKADLLGTAEKTKTWLLIANAADPTLLRNTISLKLALYMGSEGTPSCEPCDLYYNGEYRGSYLLTEKVKVEKNGVNIDDLDDANEDANDGSSAWENPWGSRQWATNSRGSEFSYVAGLSNPDDITGGYLVELDDKALPNSEVSMFYSKTHFFTVHTPEYASYEESAYVSELVGAGIDAAINGGTDPVTGANVGNLFDLDSLLATGLTEDFVVDGDYLYSSSYFYVPRSSGKIFVGPVWDCDGTFDLSCASSPSAFAQSFLSGNSSLLAKAGQVFRARLYPVVWGVLLGDEDTQTADGSLRSLAYYRNQIAASQAMDQRVWGIAPLEDEWVSYNRVEGKGWSSYVDDLATYMTRRLSYQYDFYRQSSWKYCTWRGSSIDTWVPYVDGKAVGDGWVMDGLSWYYMSSGKLQTGWRSISGSWYWFDPSTGAMASGWIWDGSNWYYANVIGRMQTGWVRNGGSWYYLEDSGAMATGWRMVDGYWYYLSGSGAMLTGWQKLGGSWYLLDDSGAMKTSWQKVDGVWYFLSDSGAMVHDCWVGDYYLTTSGAMATNQWIDSRWWVGADGKWLG